MLRTEQDRVVVVLVRARNPANIGAVARAMHDFGYTQLRVVNDYPVPFAAAKSAVDAASVLQAASEHTSLADAIADCTIVLGTTAVGERALLHPLHELHNAASQIRTTLAHHSDARIALLFGSEKTGLSNDELSHCHALVTIPMNKLLAEGSAARHLSMNLGQAVAVCLYVIAAPSSASIVQPHTPPPAPDAPAGDIERLTSLLQEVLDRSGYTRRHPASAREESVRRLVRRMSLSVSDTPVWTGIVRQLLHALPRGSDLPPTGP